MRSSSLREVFFVLPLVSICIVSLYLVSISLYPRISEHEGISSSIFSTRAKKSNVEEPTESAEKSKNLVDEFEAYLRYTSSITQFPLQAESWVLRSMSLFWPKNSKVVILDKENEEDRKYGSTLNETTQNKKLDLRVCHMEPYAQEIIHH